MREVLIRVRAILARRWVLLAWLVLTAGACALTALPLMNLPGYELGEAVALAQGLTGGLFAIAASRHDRSHPQLTALAVTGLLWTTSAVAFLFASALAWLTTPCDPFVTAHFFPVLTLPSALVSASVGALLGRRIHRRWLANLAWLGVILVSAALTTWPILFGPQVFAYDHLGGFLPGPLYDEELHLPASLLWFRVGTVALSLGLLAVGARRTRLALACFAVFLTIETNGARLGFRMTDRELVDRLGGTRENEHLTLHYPRAMAPADVARAFEDANFRFQQVARFLGAVPDGRVTVWWYESPAQKKALVGAAHTQFSKPWRREVHVNAIDFPHPVLKHELVHAMASVWGAAPFAVTARFGIFVNAGIVEGLAVAADNPVDDLRLHEWTAAMKKKGLLPDARALLGADGFYAANPQRAYATAGSFLRYLTEKYGPAKTRELYRHGRFEEVYGVPLSSLVTEYESFLDTVPLDDAAVNQAFTRFKGGSLFDRPCAREVVLLAERAAADRSERGLALWRRCRALQPDDPGHALAESRVLSQLDRDDEAKALLDELLVRTESEAPNWIDVAMARVSVAVKQNDLPHARALLERVLERSPSPVMDRTARVRLAGLEDPGIRAHFDGTGDVATVYRLRGEYERGGSWAVRYLLGRKLQLAQASSEALPLLEATAADPEVPASVAQEAARLGLEAALEGGDCGAIERLGHSRRFGPAFDARTEDWLERCRFSVVAKAAQDR